MLHPASSPIHSDPRFPLYPPNAISSVSGDPDASQKPAPNRVYTCKLPPTPASAAGLLVIGAAVPVGIVNRVAKGRIVVVGQLRVVAQNVVVLGRVGRPEGRTAGGSIGTWVGPAGPACIELPGRWLVLICEEGLVPPINTDSSDKCLSPDGGNKGDG
jgi:hypothetical protein